MVKISFVTLFPESFSWLKDFSIIKKALAKNLVELEVINFRNWSQDKNQRVDDYQFGGGAGMVIGLQAICDCLKAIKTPTSKVYLLTPTGLTFNQELAKQLVTIDHLILICGHYEGFDARLHHYIDGQISIGDYILSGGEIPAMVIADSIIRLIPGVITIDSLISESFENYLLDYPIYTKPVIYDGHEVPNILLSGNHKLIANWRYQKQLELTKQHRYDLYQKHLEVKKGK